MAVADVAHIGLTPVIGESFKDREGTSWLVKMIEQSNDNNYDIYLKSLDSDYEDWFTLSSEMLVNYALTRRPA